MVVSKSYERQVVTGRQLLRDNDKDTSHKEGLQFEVRVRALLDEPDGEEAGGAHSSWTYASVPVRGFLSREGQLSTVSLSVRARPSRNPLQESIAYQPVCYCVFEQHGPL